MLALLACTHLQEMEGNGNLNVQTSTTNTWVKCVKIRAALAEERNDRPAYEATSLKVCALTCRCSLDRMQRHCSPLLTNKHAMHGLRALSLHC
jgi:hypothetical protein